MTMQISEINEVDYVVPERRIRAGLVEGGLVRTQVIDAPSESVSEAEVTAVWQAAGVKARGERVVELLHRYGVLRSFQLRYLAYEQTGLNANSARTLSKMEFSAMAKYGILQQIAIFGDHSAYVLGDWGRAWLRIAKGVRRFQADRGKILGTRGSQLWHDLMAADFQMAVLMDVESVGGQMDWLRATDSDSPVGRTVQWDGLGRIEFAGKVKFDYYLEIDRDTETIREFAKKVRRYAKYLKEGSWRAELGRASFPEVLVVTSGNEARLMRLREAVLSWIHKLGLSRELVWDFTTLRRLDSTPHYNPLDATAWSANQHEDGYALLKYGSVCDGVERELAQLRTGVLARSWQVEEQAERMKVLEQARTRLAARLEGVVQ